MNKGDVTFDGGIPERYDRHLGPALFDPYAADLAARVPASAVRVLEVACGTGIVTRRLRERLGAAARITATDLSPDMVRFAASRVAGDSVAGGAVEFRPADACSLPFPDATFDALVCQFGVMFVPDKLAAFREARRVLAPGGMLLFNVWDALAANAVTLVADGAIRGLFAADPPRFYEIPFGFHDDGVIRPLLREAGFRTVTRTEVPMTTRSPSAEDLATGLVQGTPMATAIRERNAVPVEAVTRAVAGALAAAFGAGPLAAPMRAVVYSAV